MFFKLFLISYLLNIVYCKSLCSYETAIKSFRRPSYEFSLQLLDRLAQDTSNHFVFSPLSTWIQLTTLSEGARGDTLKEISKVTKPNRLLCNRKLLKEVLNDMNKDFQWNSARKSFIIIDQVFEVKSEFKEEIEKGNINELLLVDFNKPLESAAEANEIISYGTEGIVNDLIDPNDFNETTILMADTSYFKSNWKYPFNPAYTERSPFYSKENVQVGEINLMSQIGYFNVVTIPYIDAQVLELSCDEHDRTSMLIFLPTQGKSISDLFYKLTKIRIATIYNEFKKEPNKLVRILLPRFTITTDIDSLPQLIYDMGVKKIFYPDQANFLGISDYKLYASLMTQIASIEVTEEGLKAEAAEFLMSEVNIPEFRADKSFGFILLDKKTHVILYAGIYSVPTLF